MRNVQYENLETKIYQLLIDGDRAVVHRTTTIRDRGASGTYTFDAIDFFRFRDGLVVEFSECADLASREAVKCFPL